MIEITQALVRQLRTVYRKTFGAGKNHTSGAWIILQAGKDGLVIRAFRDALAVEYSVSGSFDAETLVLPFEALQEIEGNKALPVSLENVKPQCVQVRWSEAGIPQLREYASKDLQELPAWPDPPEKLSQQDPSFLSTLAEAMKTVASDHIRYALDKIQLCGSGKVVATDGRHLLVQSGFSFPWKEDLLVQTVNAFGCRELPQDEPVSIGKNAKHVFVQVGAWTILLPIDTESRYPKAEQVIPATNGSVTTWRLETADAEFLLRTLPKLPMADGDDYQSVTVDLDGTAVIRATRETAGPVTEVMLDRSTAVGPARRFVTNRRYLTRAIELGFCEFQVVNNNSPIVCKEPQRTFIWMTLGENGALTAADNAVQIHSSSDAPAKPPAVQPRRTPMPTTSTNGNGTTNGAVHANGNGHPAVLPMPRAIEKAPTTGTLAAIIKEAEDLQDVSRETCRRLTRLVSSLKRHRKQTRLMSSTLASLRQLQQLPAVA